MQSSFTVYIGTNCCSPASKRRTFNIVMQLRRLETGLRLTRSKQTGGYRFVGEESWNNEVSADRQRIYRASHVTTHCTHVLELDQRWKKVVFFEKKNSF